MNPNYGPPQSGTLPTQYTDQVTKRQLRSDDQARTIQQIGTGSDSGSSLSFSSEVENNSTSSQQARASRFTSILLGLLIFVGVITGVAIFVREKAPLRRTKNSTSSAVSYTELATHDSPVDCWMAIHGQVFDLTDYEHPGGQDYIYDQCGADATDAYGIVHDESLLITAEPFFRGFLQDEAVPTGTPLVQPPSSSLAPTVIGERYINSSQLAMHNLAETDCWVVYHGKVFDMTTYATEHPGGRANITDFCGSDATEEFAASHPLGYLNFISKYNVGLYGGSMPNHTVTITVPESPATSPSVVSPESTLREVQLIDAEELSTHDDPDADCWVVYHGNVYNMTEYAAKHPGGPGNITDFCGTDSTIEYAAVHSLTYLGLIKKYLVGFSSEPSEYTPPPTSEPGYRSPTHEPTGTPTASPTRMPTSVPSAKPTSRPTSLPTSMPTVKPSPLPTSQPVSATLYPSPTQSPSQKPLTSSPTNVMWEAPVSTNSTASPTTSSSRAPTTTGTPPPSRAPATRAPTSSPVTNNPTSSPTQRPTKPPTMIPSLAPTLAPTKTPTSTPTKSPVTPLPTGSPTPKPTQLPGQCYTTNEVAQHASEIDCWYILYGEVYDFTDYMDLHPAGPELIASECGTDATLVFETAKKHDANLLVKKGGDAYKIGPTCESPATPLPPTPKPTQLPGQCYTINDVAQHASEIDCWYILYGEVYDFTDSMDLHPAGPELIASECGTDATLVFETAKKHDANLLVKKGGDAFKIGISC